MSSLNEVLKFISQCDDVSKDRIIDALNTQRRVANNEATSKLHIGARVQFDSRKRGRVIEGIVTKINRKSVKLDCGNDGKWSVAPTFITLIK